MKTALLVALFPAASLAGTVVLEPVKDATLYQDPDADGQQALANGSGGFLFIGRTDQPPNPLSPTPSPVRGLLRRSLLKFEVSSAVPTEAIVLDAKLELTVTNIPRSITSDDRDATLHRVLADWAEGPSDPDDPEGIGAIVGDGEATWTHRISGTSAWATPGGDFVPDVSATEVVAENFTRYSWEGIGMLDDVRAWISGVAENHGWIMLGDESVPKTARRFNSRTNSTFPVTFRPSLTIDFLFPTEILASDSAAGRKRRSGIHDGRRPELFSRIGNRPGLVDGAASGGRRRIAEDRGCSPAGGRKPSFPPRRCIRLIPDPAKTLQKG